MIERIHFRLQALIYIINSVRVLKSSKKTFCALLICYFVSQFSYAQDFDPLTGRASISIPLGGISAGDISIPVTLYHHGNSLRVAEGPGNAGMGFNVSIGGAVSRMVRGIPDDYNVANDSRKGWLFNSNASYVQNFNSTSDDNLSICTDEANDRAFLMSLLYSRDSEPDLFYINAPGLSCQFVFGADGTPKIIGYQDLQITTTTSPNGISQFIIKTNSGRIYTFGLGVIAKRKAEKFKSWIVPNYFLTDYNIYSNELTYIPTWYLTTIESTATGVKANFGYQMSDEILSNEYRTRISSAATPAVDTIYTIRDRRQDSNITQVTLSAGANVSTHQISITWSDDLISKISISETASGSSQEFGFEYFSVSSSLDLTWPKVEKQFLKEVKQQRACVTTPSFEFEYIDVASGTGVQVPWKNNDQQDYFGFFNGKTGNKNTPKIYFYSSEVGARRLRTTPIPGLTPTQFLDGHDRSVDTAKVKFGAVKTISYPTGAKTSFYYESNRYFDTSTNEEFFGGGVRVKKIITSGGETLYGGSKGSQPVVIGRQTFTRSFDYTLAGSATTSGKLLNPPSFAFVTGSDIIRTKENLNGNEEIIYSRVKENIIGRGSIVYEFSTPGVYPQSVDGTWSATKSKLARYACTTSNYANSIYTFPFAPNTEFSFARGYLTKRSEYTEAGTLTRETQSTYSLAGTPLTIKGVKYEPLGDDLVFGNYAIITGQANLLTSETVKEYSEETTSEFTQVSTAYQYNAKLLPILVTRTNDDNSIVKQQFRYALDFAVVTPPGTDWAADAIKKLNTAFRYSEVLERIQKYTPPGGTEIVTGAQLTLFRDLSGRVLPYQTKNFPQGATYNNTVLGPTHSFDYDTDYITDVTLEEYDVYGRLINTVDNNKNRSSIHYALNQGIPVATFTNARSQEGIFEGFEFPTGRGMSYTGGTVVTGWTGDKAVQLISTGKLTSASISSSGNLYRVSMWAKAAQATNVTITAKNGTTTIQTLILNYNSGSINNWTYLEGILNLTSPPASYTIEITVNGTMQLDDIVLIKNDATISTQTVMPLIGVTSQTDDRGNSVKFSYDAYGRKKNTWDAKRNLVSVNEYLVQRDITPTINAGFTYSADVIKQGQSITFTANAICVPVAYQWKVDGVLQASTASTLLRSFNYGMHNIEMITTNATYGSKSFSINVCVDMPTPTFSVSVAQPTTIYACSPTDDRVRTFTMNYGPSCAGASVTYLWYITDINSNWILLTTGAVYNTATISYASPSYSYYMRCDVVVNCGSADSNCGYSKTFSGSASSYITFINNQPCQ